MNVLDSFQWSTMQIPNINCCWCSSLQIYLHWAKLLFLTNSISGSTLEDYMHVKNSKALACECAATWDGSSSWLAMNDLQFLPPPSVSIPSRLDIMLSSWIYHLNSISSRSELTIHQEPRASKALERLKIITSCLKLQSWQLQCQRSHVQDMQLKLWHWPNLSRWWVLCLLWWVILLFAKTFRFWWKRSPHPLSCIWDLYFTCSWPSTTHAAVHSCQTVKAVNITK